MRSLQSIEEFQTLKAGAGTVFLFTANWCPDCHFIDPFMPEVEEKFAHLQFVSVNRDEFTDLCIELDIFGIPSFIVYKEDQELGRFVSKDRKTKQEIEDFLTSVIVKA